jgi:release factor glutamine methyltransferase
MSAGAKRRERSIGGPQPRSIRELLAVSTRWLEDKGSESARTDAELLLAHALGESRLGLYLDLDRPLSDKERDAFRPLLARRGRAEPVAYILEEKEFYGLPFKVGPAVLVPRPDTESLVEQALARLPEGQEGLVLDVCTGSGCVAVALAHARPGLKVLATDLARDALAVAAENVARHRLTERVELRAGDALEPLQGVLGALLLVSNPPYIRRADEPTLMPDVRGYEPAAALFGEDEDGLGVHRRLLRGARRHLGPRGAVLLECGYDQGEALAALEAPGLGFAGLYKDLGGHSRGGVWDVLEG